MKNACIVCLIFLNLLTGVTLLTVSYALYRANLTVRIVPGVRR